MNDTGTRNRALGGLGTALLVGVLSWFFIDRQTDRGLARLNMIDHVWKACESSYANARSANDTSRIDASRLIAVIDSGKEGELHRCGDMRRPQDAEAARDSARKAQENRYVVPTRN